MLYGTYMGGFWILKFALFPSGLTRPMLMFLFIGLTIFVPYMAYRYAKLYRDQACDGHIRFSSAWAFTMMEYLFAALLAAVAHYVYFRFIDHGYVIDTYQNLIDSVSTTDMPALEPYVKQLDTALSGMRTLTPTDITLQLFSQNIFYRALLAVPTALLVMKRPADRQSNSKP